jgi:hypothetical protein
MQKINLFLAFCFILFSTVKAQTPPNAFNYSAVARNSSGQPIATTTIGIQITILKTSPTGTSVYSENHFVNTDQFGLFNLTVGAGAVQSGSISTIDWSNDNYYFKVGMDANGGTNFLTMGTTQLLSVPYALYAKSAGSAANNNDGDTSATNELQTLSIRSDTIFLTNGAFVKLPVYNDKDTSSTNELQTLSISNDTIYLTNGFFVKLPAYNDIDTSSTNELQSLSISSDTIILTNGGFVKLPAGVSGGSFSHTIGEQFGGGVIFHLFKDAQGVEHGLIVDKTDLSTNQVWSNNIQSTLIGASAQSSWDGLSNSNAIVGQAGHISSAAALCLNSTNSGQSDWYLPSIDELSLLWHSRFNVNKSLSAIGGATVLPNSAYYWSSSESSASTSRGFDFSLGFATSGDGKGSTYYVRAIRAF